MTRSGIPLVSCCERQKGELKMVSAKSPSSINGETDLEVLKSLWQEIRDHLKNRKQLIDKEIRSYPTPIPRCDAQFNHLYEQRTRLFRELNRMNALAEKSLARGDYIELIEEFISSVTYTDAEAEQTMRAQLEAKLFKIRN
jgi:hypothetical protein